MCGFPEILKMEGVRHVKLLFQTTSSGHVKRGGNGIENFTAKDVKWSCGVSWIVSNNCAKYS